MEYERLKQLADELEAEKKRLEAEQKALKAAKKNNSKISLPKMPSLSLPDININIGVPSKKGKTEQIAEPKEFVEAEYIEITDQYDPMDLNRDGVVDEKDVDLLKELLNSKN